MILISGSTLIAHNSMAEDAHEGFEVLHVLCMLFSNDSNNPVVMFGVVEIVHQLLFSANNIRNIGIRAARGS